MPRGKIEREVAHVKKFVRTLTRLEFALQADDAVADAIEAELKALNDDVQAQRKIKPVMERIREARKR